MASCDPIFYINLYQEICSFETNRQEFYPVIIVTFCTQDLNNCSRPNSLVAHLAVFASSSGLFPLPVVLMEAFDIIVVLPFQSGRTCGCGNVQDEEISAEVSEENKLLGGFIYHSPQCCIHPRYVKIQ